MSDVQTSGRLPAEEVNGLERVYKTEFLEPAAPEPVHVVARIERTKRTVADVDESVSAQARITAIEVLDDEVGAKLLADARRERTGDAELPIDQPEDDTPADQFEGVSRPFDVVNGGGE